LTGFLKFNSLIKEKWLPPTLPSKRVIAFYCVIMVGEGRMDEEGLIETSSQLNCNHKENQLYTERCFDILNGFELIFTRCLNCHKVVSLEAKKFESR